MTCLHSNPLSRLEDLSVVARECFSKKVPILCFFFLPSRCLSLVAAENDDKIMLVYPKYFLRKLRFVSTCCNSLISSALFPHVLPPVLFAHVSCLTLFLSVSEMQHPDSDYSQDIFAAAFDGTFQVLLYRCFELSRNRSLYSAFIFLLVHVGLTFPSATEHTHIKRF